MLVVGDAEFGGGGFEAEGAPPAADGAVGVVPVVGGLVLVGLVGGFAGGVAGEVGGGSVGVGHAHALGPVDSGAGGEVFGVPGADDFVPGAGDPFFDGLVVDLLVGVGRGGGSGVRLGVGTLVSRRWR